VRKLNWQNNRNYNHLRLSILLFFSLQRNTKEECFLTLGNPIFALCLLCDTLSDFIIPKYVFM
jgi:hypothetical protein